MALVMVCGSSAAICRYRTLNTAQKTKLFGYIFVIFVDVKSD